VPVDRFLRVDGLVAHGGVDVLVAEDELGDVACIPLRIASVAKILRKTDRPGTGQVGASCPASAADLPGPDQDVPAVL
jgi:hypothetical protein